MKIELKDIQVLNEAVELLGRNLPHSREATLAPLVKATRDKLVAGYRAQAIAETEASLSQVETPELIFLLDFSAVERSVLLGGWAQPPYVDTFVNFNTTRSKVIRTLSYNFKTQELRIHFVNGRVWSYLNVPVDIFEDVLYGDGPERSVGKAYNRLLKNQSQYESAPVVDGKREPKAYTVHLSYLMDVAGIRFDSTKVVEAATEARAIELARESVASFAGAIQVLEVREGRWFRANDKWVAYGSLEQVEPVCDLKTYTVVLMVTGRVSCTRLRTVEVVQAKDAPDAFWKAKEKAEKWAVKGSGAHVETREGRWRDAFEGGLVRF